MYHVLILTDREVEPGEIPWAVEEGGLSYDVGIEIELNGTGTGEPVLRPDAVLLDLDSLNEEKARGVVSSCRQLGHPVMAVLSAQKLPSYDSSLNPDDFILQPFGPGELVMRLNQVISRNGGEAPQGKQILRVADLLVETERYEVRVAGRKVILTYKEYRLLLLLASNPGKVYTRDTLLSQVWSYDYFGGTRTVDVHIRRLRSKLEDASHSFI